MLAAVQKYEPKSVLNSRTTGSWFAAEVFPVMYTKGKAPTQKPCAWYAVVKNDTLTAPKGYGPVCPAGISPPPLG